MWNNFVPCTTDEETITNGFSNCRLFTITSDTPVSTHPVVLSAVQNKKMVLAVEQSFFLLEDENSAECGYFSFGSHIECFVLSPSGNFVICALADGNIHGIHMNGIRLFNLAIDTSDVNNSITFIGISQFKNEYYLMCSSGTVYRVFNIDESVLCDSSFSEKITDTSVLNETFLDVNLDKMFSTKYDDKITSFCIISILKDLNNSVENDIKAILGGEKYLYFHTNNKNVKIELPRNIDGIKSIYNLDHFVLGLSTNGILFEICFDTKLLHPIANDDTYLIDDYVVIENSENEIELLILTKPNNTGHRSLKIIEYPSMKSNFDLSVPCNSWLIRQPKSLVNMYVLYGNQRDTPFVQEIELKMISETQPAERLKKLIHKGHLDEAEDFAKQFNLSAQPIYQAKAKRVVYELALTNQNNLPRLEEIFTELLSIIKLITDSNYILSLRHIEISDRTIMKTFLLYLIENLSFEQFQNDYDEIKEQLLRLGTLQLIDPYECNKEWQRFLYHSNLKQVVTKMFTTDMEKACLIWKYHSSNIMTFINKSNTTTVLNAIPATAEPFQVIQWLRHFVPCVTQMYPDTMTEIVDWSIQKTKSLQYSKHWPEIGLEFINNIFAIFTDINYLFSDLQRHFEVNIEKLQSIVNVLQDLSILKNSYNLSLTLDDYINDSIEDTAFQILQRINLNNLEKMANDFLYPIFIEKGLTPINAIIRYIHFLVKYYKSISLWQERSVVCIEMLHNEENKLKCVLLVLKAAPVPWADTLTPLLKYGSSSHPLSLIINTEYHLQTIKIMKVKYGWCADSPDNLMKLAYRIIKMNLPDVIEDITNLVKSNPSICSNVTVYCGYELARKGFIEKSIQFIDSLNETQCKECCEKILNIVLTMMDNKFENQENINNLIEFLKFVNERMDKQHKLKFNDIYRLRIIRNQFQIDISYSDLNDAELNLSNLEEGISYLVDGYKNLTSNFVEKAWNDIILFAKVLNINKIFAINQLLKQIRNVHFSCAIAMLVLNFFYVNEDSYCHYIDLAVLLLVHQIEAFDKSNEDNPMSMSYPIVYRLLQDILHYNKMNYLEIRELLCWTRIGNQAYDIKELTLFFQNKEMPIDQIFIKQMNDDAICNNAHRRDSMSIFENVSKTTNVIKQHSNPEPIIRCTSFTLKLLTILNIKCPPFDRFKIHMRIDNDSSEDIKIEFYAALEHLIKSKQYSVSFVLVHYILKQQQKLGVIIVPELFVNKLHKKIMRHALLQKEPNFTEVQAILGSDQKPEECLKYLENELKHGQMKINYMILQESFNISTDNLHQVAVDRDRRIKYFYYTELCKIDSTLKSRTSMEFLSIENLMKELNNKILHINLLNKISIDFVWDYQEVLISQVITILSLQELKFDVNTDILGKDEIIIKTTVKEIINICQPYINEITSIDTFAFKLNEFFDSINFYFYELYLCVIEILTDINTLSKDKIIWSRMLLFLKHKMITKRKNRIGQIETDLWLKSQTEVGVLPKIASYRFPFKLIAEGHLQNLLDDEVNVENCDQWFALIKCHCELASTEPMLEMIKLQDYFCMSAVKNSISEYKNNSHKQSETWSLRPINNAFLQSILRLIQHINDISKVLLILYFVTNQAPEGADQVEAAYECYKFAIDNEAELLQMKRANETVFKIKRKYPIFKTLHLLHLFGLVDDKLFQLVENPKELINALYLHEFILNPQKPDINKVAKEIAELHNMNIYEIQVSTIKKWLACSAENCAIDIDETFYEELETTISNDDTTIGDEYILRVHYILSSWDAEKSTHFLISQIFPIDGAVNTGKQLQVFECFMKLNRDTNSSYLEVINQEQYINLKCVHYLKQLGYKFSIEKFIVYDKISILRKVWATHANNVKGLEVITYICIGYDIYETKIWNGVLKQMATLNMVKQLSSLVELISTKKSLLHTEGLTLAWECIVMHPFKNANKTKSHEQETVLCKSLFLLQSCPLASKINLIELAEHCIRLDRCHMAAILITFTTNEQKSTIIKMVQQHKSDTLKTNITALEDLGIYSFVTKLVINELQL